MQAKLQQKTPGSKHETCRHVEEAWIGAIWGIKPQLGSEFDKWKFHEVSSFVLICLPRFSISEGILWQWDVEFEEHHLLKIKDEPSPGLDLLNVEQPKTKTDWICLDMLEWWGTIALTKCLKQSNITCTKPGSKTPTPRHPNKYHYHDHNHHHKNKNKT